MTWLLTFLGLPAILGPIVQTIAVIVQTLWGAFVEMVKVVWENITKPGLKTIFSSFASVATVAMLMGAIYGWDRVSHTREMAQVRANLNTCQLELRKFRKSAPKAAPVSLPWPFGGW